MSPEQERKARHQFAVQRSGAASRGIGWELTFEQWWQIWQESGRYHERGVYVMARNWDVGPYAVGNVEIQTQSQNVLTYWARRRARHVKHNPPSVPFASAPDPLEILIAEEDGEEAA
jgi:hypothetical protein